MVADIDVFIDKEGKHKLTNLGTVDVGETKEIPIFLINIGTTTLIDLKIEHSFEDAQLHIDMPRLLKAGEVIEGKILWTPEEEKLEGEKNGSISVMAKSIGKYK